MEVANGKLTTPSDHWRPPYADKVIIGAKLDPDPVLEYEVVPMPEVSENLASTLHPAYFYTK